MKNKVQLITYPDSLGSNLKDLHFVLNNYLKNLFEGGVHILPPFPSSGDRGFAPLTYFEIEPNFGTWTDMQNIASEYDVMLDLMVNHISQQSGYFHDFLCNGKESKYADLFITLDKISPEGLPSKEDIDKIFLRRALPYSTFAIGEEQTPVNVWTTFGKQNPSEQIDFDINSATFKQLIKDILVHFAEHDIKMVRLDAVGYVIKKLGTTCFWVEPDIYNFLDWVKSIADSCNITLLPEVHSHYSIQNKLSEHGFWIYDFILPYSILEALQFHNTTNLYQYVLTRKPNQFTMLDCHDGIPVKPDLDDLVTTTEARKVVDECLKKGANLSYIFSEKHKAADGFDVHQIRCSFYSMLDANDDAYIAARAIQFFVPGIPQVYYVGLLAGENDVQKVNETGEGREINRHNFSLDEIETAVKKPVVKRLFKLIQFRNEVDVFNGSFSVSKKSDNDIILSWKSGNSYCTLTVDTLHYTTEAEYSATDGNKQTIKF